MKKLASLRRAVLSAKAGKRGAALSPERVSTCATKGKLRFFDGATDDYELTYTAEVIATGFAGDPLILFRAVCGWLRAECPGADPDLVTFEIDVLDGAACDVMIEVEITETVRARGAEVAAEPDPDIADVDAFLGLGG